MGEKQLEFQFETPPRRDRPLITPDLVEASNCLDQLFFCWQRDQYRDAHTYALKLRLAATDLARELEKFIY